MGSPLGPTLANFFLAHFEKQFTGNLNFGPDLYLRYVNGIFCVFRSQDRIAKFLDFLNNLHDNLKFTHEIGGDRIPSLDTEIMIPSSNNTNVCDSIVYRKPTNTDVLLNFSVLCLMKWKIGLILCFLNQAYQICSNWNLFHVEVTKLSDIFLQNGCRKTVQ